MSKNRKGGKGIVECGEMIVRRDSFRNVCRVCNYIYRDMQTRDNFKIARDIRTRMNNIREKKPVAIIDYSPASRALLC